MSLEVRRVITGHNAEGRATVLIDETMKTFPQRAGATGAIVWTTTGFPPTNEGDEDTAVKGPSWADGGTLFRVLQMDPGTSNQMHRTQSLDYAYVISGQMHMELDDGSTVVLSAGDTLVQRGTAHRWINNGSEPVTMLFVMMESQAIEGLPEITH